MTEPRTPMPGKLRPPYPVDECANVDCTRALDDEIGCFLFRDLETDKLVVFCEDCTAHVELNCRQRFMLVAL